MKQSLNLNIAQQLSLTPQLKQSLKLLQLSSLELEQEVQSALDNNPLLEREKVVSIDSSKDAVDDPTSGSDADMFNNATSSVAESSDPSIEMAESDHLHAEQPLNTDWRDKSESRSVTRKQKQFDDASTRPDAESFATKPETLLEHLSWQIQMTTLSQRDKLIADALLYSLDDEAYLSVDLEEICTLFPAELVIEEDEVHAVLSLIKTLDPIGVGAKDLSGRLLLLLGRLDADTPGFSVAQNIVNDHLPLLANRDVVKLKKVLAISDQELSNALSLINHLNPRIASQYSADAENYVTPDVMVKETLVNKQKKWTVELNPDNQCRLRVNQEYAQLLKTKLDAQSKDYIKQNLSQAKLYIKSLLSRYDTLLLVSEAIVTHQADFFEHGDMAMKPLILQDIAEQLEMHESTISRAISGKYLSYAGGVYELKYFFSNALSGKDGSSSSSTVIRSLIKQMVDTESKVKPLSDSKIAKKLEEKGHIVARRTVAKYREGMLIAPSSQRRELL
jgi:RNA polymerase sigma-54 factor